MTEHNLTFILRVFLSTLFQGRTAVKQLVTCCATNRKVAGSIPGGVGGIFLGIMSSQPYYEPAVDSVSNRYEYQALPGVKIGRSLWLTNLSLSCVDVLKSGKLKFPEHPGSPQVCNGTITFLLFFQK